MAIAGAFVSLKPDGTLAVERGYVRPEDERKAEDVEEDGAGDGGRDPSEGAGRSGPVITVAGEKPGADPDEDDVIRPLPDRLVLELTAHRTLALRDAVAQHPEVALTLLLHRLVTDAFNRGGSGGCLEASVRHVFFPVQAPDLKDSPSATSIAARHEGWRAELAGLFESEDEDALWNWLHALDAASRLALLAHCVSYGVNALQEKVERYGGSGVSAHGLARRLNEANRLAAAVNLDLVEAGWRPTEANYLARVTKPRILEAVREGAGQKAAELIAHLKKGDMAREAERLLSETGWLPEPLRTPGQEVDQAIGGDEAREDAGEADLSSSADLPAFLDGDEEAGNGDGADEPGAERPSPPAMAAE